MQIFTGRKEIYTSKDIDQNIKDELSKAFNKHLANASEINYLYNYYKGDQPIKNKTKAYRPEINNKVVINHASEITNFFADYVFGENIQYISRGKCLTKEHPEDSVAKLNQMMIQEEKITCDREIAQWVLITGVGYRMCLPKQENNEIPFEMGTLNPATTFLIRDIGFKNKPVLGVTYTVDENFKIKGIAYSQKNVYNFEADGLGQSISIYNITKNILRQIPIFEYRLNPEKMGVFEKVLSALDCLNSIASNRIDGIEQFVQSLLVLKGCTLEDEQIQKINQLGAINFPATDCEAQILSSQLDQFQIQSFVQDLYQTVLQITGVPDRQSSAGGNTGTALEIGQGWVVAESKAKSIEALWKKNEKEFLKVVKKIVDDSGTDLDICLSDIEIKFTRNKTANLLVKTQGMINQLNAGIHPRIAIANVELYPDPENVYLESIPYLNAKGYSEVKQVETAPQMAKDTTI